MSKDSIRKSPGIKGQTKQLMNSVNAQKELFDTNKDKMTEFLIETALKVDLTVPAVVKGQFE